jgi:predicted transcriptional regulator YheO
MEHFVMAEKENINPALKSYLPFVKGFAEILGNDCEVLLHDVAIPERSVIACENTHVTGRKLGAPMTALGLQLIQSEEFTDSDGIYNYFTETDDGRKLKCSVIFLRNKKKKLIGIICINIDVSKVELARSVLDSFLIGGAKIPDNSDNSPRETGMGFYHKYPLKPEKFYKNLDDVWDRLFQELKISPDAPLDRLSPSELKSIVKKLNADGFFLMKGSINILAQKVKKSRHTIYGYLRKLRGEDALPPEKNA